MTFEKDFEFEIKPKGRPSAVFTNVTNGYVRLSMENVAHEFQFHYADLRTNLNDPPPIEAGDECIVRICDDTVITGYVDDIALKYTADTLQLTARGRSKTGDLVDCSAEKPGDPSGKWRKATAERIVRDLCKPFGITLLATSEDASTVKFPLFAIDQGESAIGAIDRAAERIGLHVWTDKFGNLLLGEAGDDRVADKFRIEYGINVLNGERYDSRAQRFSKYTLKAQRAGTNKEGKRVVSTLKADVTDDVIERYRPLLIVTTGQGGKTALKNRAIWERNRRAGRAERFIYRVDGYRHNDVVWRPNFLVPVFDPRAGVDATLLVTDVVFKYAADGDDGGRTTDLTLARKEAFLREPYPKKRHGKPVVDGEAEYEILGPPAELGS